MKLKENIYKICKNVKTDISPDSLAALVLYTLSKEEYFKENYNHFELIERHGEIRLFSTPINNARGCTNGRLAYQVINSDPKDYHLDSFWDAGKSKDEIENPHNHDDYYFSENTDSIDSDCLLLRERKFNNIKSFFKILDKANSFDDILNSIRSENKYLLLDVKQTIMDTFRHQKDIEKLEPIFGIIESLTLMSASDGLYRLSNKDVSFGITNARDYFDCNALSSMASNIDNKDYFKKVINGGSLWSIGKLFIDDVIGEIPNDVKSIIENKETENWKAVKLYTGMIPKYKSSLLRSALSTRITSIDKHIEIANYFFDKLKKQGMDSKEYVFNRISNNENILEKYSETINIIVEKIKRDYLVLNSTMYSEKVELVEFNAVGNYDDSEQEKYLSSLYAFDFYSDDDLNKVSSGIEYGNNNAFKYSKQKDNLMIAIRNENDLIGFGHFYIENSTMRVNTVNIANHHRGKRKVELIYQKLINYAAQNNLIIQTSMYSDIGSERLPKLKKKLLEKNKGTLWIDTCTNRTQNDFEKDLVTLNESILRIISDFENVDVSLIRKTYDQQTEIFKKHYNSELSWDEKDDLRNNFLVGFKKQLIEESEIKNNSVKNKLVG